MLISKFGSAQKSEILSFNPNLPDELVRFLEKYNGGETPETQMELVLILLLSTELEM